MTISGHIKKPCIFNAWDIFKTLSNVQDDEAY